MPKETKRSLVIDTIQLCFQPEECLDEEKVYRFVERLRQGKNFPPVTVRFDGEHYLLQDGFHRLEAARRLGLTQIEAEILPGTLNDMEEEWDKATKSMKGHW